MSSEVSEALGFQPKLGVSPRILQLLRQRAFTTESLIKEFVKNSYEAEAEALYITVHPTGDIEFRDEGKYAGMAPEDIEAFLLIGTPRKAERRFTEHYKRPIAGEQGIGRLSFTQLYNIIEVETERDGKRFRFRITEDLIDKAFPEPLDMTEYFEVLEPTGVNGTKITCMGLKEGFEKPSPEKIKRYIMENFLYTLLNPRGPFHVYVNGEEVKVSVPKGYAIINVEEKVEGVVVKGGRAEDSYITGCIVLMGSQRSGEYGIQLSVNGSPIGPRRSLGEIVGDRRIDEVIPPTKVWGWIEAPFLKFTIGRDNVDTNHYTYIKFREKMRKVVEDVRVAMKRREEQEKSKIELAALSDACSILEDVLRDERGLKPGQGFVSRSAVGGFLTRLSSDKLREGAAGGRGEGEEEGGVESAHQTASIHKSTGRDERERKMREKGSWRIEPTVFEDLTLISMLDYFNGIIRINKAHPLYQRRMRNKKMLRNFILWVAAVELSKIAPDEISRNRTLARLLNKIEVAAGETL